MGHTDISLRAMRIRQTPKAWGHRDMRGSSDLVLQGLGATFRGTRSRVHPDPLHPQGPRPGRAAGGAGARAGGWGRARRNTHCAPAVHCRLPPPADSARPPYLARRPPFVALEGPAARAGLPPKGFRRPEPRGTCPAAAAAAARRSRRPRAWAPAARRPPEEPGAPRGGGRGPSGRTSGTCPFAPGPTGPEGAGLRAPGARSGRAGEGRATRPGPPPPHPPGRSRGDPGGGGVGAFGVAG